MQPKPLLTALIAVILLSACASDEVQDLDATELQYYERAQSSLRSSNFSLAVDRLQLLEARFPFGRYAQQAQLEIVYAYYKSNQPEAARAAADRFIRLHPQHPSVDYAYYLRGMASFDEDASFFSQYLPLDPASRDPGAARESFNDFAMLINRFPQSQYAPDARQRMIYLRNLLARSELNVARYYIYRGAYVAAANRGRYVFENFQETPAVPDALAIMAEAYGLMKMDTLASEALQVLSTNFPNHPRLTKEGTLKASESVKSNERSLLSRLTFGLVG